MIIEILKLVIAAMILVIMILVPLAEIVWALKMMNTVWDVRYREQRLKLECEDMQRREHLLLAGWEELNKAKGSAFKGMLASKRADSDENLVQHEDSSTRKT